MVLLSCLDNGERIVLAMHPRRSEGLVRMHENDEISPQMLADALNALLHLPCDQLAKEVSYG